MEISKVLDPFDEARGCGGDVRYDPLFDALQSEVEKLTCPSFTGIVDWEGVVELSSDILANKSKDLVVTGYLAVALIHTRHEEGVLTSLRVYHDMLKKFWDELYPPVTKARGRVLSVEWWLEKTLKALALRKVRLSRQQAFAALEVVERIDLLLTGRLPGTPSLEALKRFFLEQQHPVTEEGSAGGDARSPVPHEPEPASCAGACAAGESAARTVADVAGGDAEGEQGIDDALQRVCQGALLLRREDPVQGVAYRLARVSLWSTVSVLPPALEGRTRIPPPEHQQVALLRELRQQGAAEALLDAAEGALTQSIFWLDLNRFSHEALAHLGERSREAQEAIAQETCHLVSRFPGVVELAFSDGTPFADEETRRWLQQRGARLPASPERCATEGVAAITGGGGAFEGGGAVEAALGKALREAQSLAREGQLSEAVRTLHARVEMCRSGRERLVWRMVLVEFLLEASAARQVLPQLEMVLAEVERHGLTRYDPELALRALALAYVAFQAVDDPAFAGKAREALFRIGELDPAEMVRLETGTRLS